MVMNDGGYGVIRHIQDAVADGRGFGDTPLMPNLEALAAIAGQPYFRARHADEIGPVLAQALAVRGPAMLEVDMASVGELPGLSAVFHHGQTRGTRARR